MPQPPAALDVKADPQLREQFARVFNPPTQDQAPAAEATPDDGSNVAVDTSAASDASPSEAGSNQDGDAFQPDPSDSPDIAKLKANLKKGFYQATQRLADQQKAVTDELSVAKQKAQTLDALLNHPNPEKVIELLKQGQGAQAASQQPTFQRTSIDNLPEEIKNGFDDGALQSIHGFVDHQIGNYLQQHLYPVLEKYQRVIEQYGQQRYESDIWGPLEKEYPTAKQYRKEAESIAVKHGIPMDEALLLASKGKIMLERAKAATEEKRSKELTPTGAPAVMTKTVNGRITFDKAAIARDIAAEARRMNLNIFQSY